MNFTEINEYDYWANTQVLDKLLQYEASLNTGLQYHHILEANIIWHNRLNNLPIDPKIWDENYDLELFKERTETNYLNLKKYLNSGVDINSTIQYKNMKGDEFESSVGTILNHIFNHSTHHRAQILLLWSQSKLERPPLDYIYYSWTR